VRDFVQWICRSIESGRCRHNGATQPIKYDFKVTTKIQGLTLALIPGLRLPSIMCWFTHEKTNVRFIYEFYIILKNNKSIQFRKHHGTARSLQQPVIRRTKRGRDTFRSPESYAIWFSFSKSFRQFVSYHQRWFNRFPSYHRLIKNMHFWFVSNLNCNKNHFIITIMINNKN